MGQNLPPWDQNTFFTGLTFKSGIVVELDNSLRKLVEISVLYLLKDI